MPRPSGIRKPVCAAKPESPSSLGPLVSWNKKKTGSQLALGGKTIFQKSGAGDKNSMGRREPS